MKSGKKPPVPKADKEEYARQQAHQNADSLCAPVMLTSVSMASGVQLTLDVNTNSVKLCVGGVWHVKTFEEFVALFTK